MVVDSTRRLHSRKSQMPNCKEGCEETTESSPPNRQFSLGLGDNVLGSKAPKDCS